MIALINWFIDVLYAVVSFVLNMLPDSPFQQISEYDGVFKGVFGTIAYFVPISEMLGITVAFLGAVIVWYAYRWLLRLSRYIN